MFENKGIFLALTLLSVSYNASASPVELNWTGCDISKDAYVSSLANSYKRKTGIQINVHAGNSAASGIRDVNDGQADIGCTSRYQIPNDPHETNVELLPLAWDALAIIVHKDNAVTNISLDQLKAIYTGKIKNWSELGGENHKIEVFAHQNKKSASGRALRESLFSDVDKKITASRVFDSNDSLEQTLMENPYAIAITGISGVRLQDIKIIALNGVTPAVDNIKSGEYVLYHPLYLSYNPNSPNIESIKEFISYVNSKTGRNVMRSNGVVPYREAMSLVMKKVRENEATYPLTVDKL